MNAFRLMGLLLSLGLFGACANSVNIYTDYLEDSDFSSYKTYRWYDDVVRSRTSEIRSYNSSDKLIRETVNAVMKKHGLRPNTAKGGEFLVNYRISSEARMNMNSFNNYNQPGVHGGVSTGTYGTSVAIGVSTGSSGPSYYREGTVVLDVIDAASNSVVWRSVAEGKLPKKMGLKERNEIIRELVPRMLKDFPPQ